MERVIFVEVLGRRGDVAQRVRLAQLPATIGRGYGCDVIVADPLVDAQHARLALDDRGTVVLEDLGSLNGLYRDGARRRTARIVLEGVTSARIGRTYLRIVPADAPVPAALPDTDAGRLAELLGRPSTVVAVLSVGFALTLLSFWLGSYESKAASVAGGEALGVAVLSAAWAGAWALIGRVTVQRFSFWPHLMATWLFLVAAGAAGTVGGYIDFLFPDRPLLALPVLLATAILWVALLVRHLGLATLMARRRRVAVAAALAGALLGLGLLTARLASDEFGPRDTVPISSSLKPVPARMIPATGLEALLRTSDGLKQEIDALKPED